ncbi:MAG: peptidase T [Erysipelotrichia bacterium]|nr:peptidase T [Erysipelotrichia bacterium]
MDIAERFINYTKIDTTSYEDTGKVPSSDNQLLLADKLKEELQLLSLENVQIDNNGFVYATLAKNTDKKCPTVGFLAHMDTSNATSGKDIHARIIEDYDGKDIVLSDNIVTRVKDYPFLESKKGKKLIVTDGKTLLGGDDKAGIAIIMDAMQYLLQHPEVKHGRIEICFTPDEEIGEGIKYIDLNRFKCDYAYTFDGGSPEEVCYENFNAATAEVKFYGNSIHPGSAKNKMVNALQLAIDFHSMLPVNERPEFTEGREGFNHLLSLNGECQNAVAVYILRNHDAEKLNKQMNDFCLAEDYLNKLYGQKVVEVVLKKTYKNMIECLQNKMYIVENAAKALAEENIKVTYPAIRGGTDGAQLSFMGIPTPNLGTGDYNCHGNHELVCVDEMQLMSKVLINLVKIIEKESKL